jgi:hypothetical protein
MLFIFGCAKSTDEIKNNAYDKLSSHIEEFKSDDDKVKVYIHLDKKEISIVENLKMIIEIHKPQDIVVIFPKEDNINLTHFSVGRIDDLITSTDGNNDVLKRTFTLLPEEIGEGSIDSIDIEYMIGDKSDKLTTKSIKIPILSYTGKDENQISFMEKLNPESLQPNYTKTIVTILIIVGILIFSALTFFIIRLIMRNRRKKEHIEITPAYKIALKAFNELQKENLINKGEIELFYRKLSLILREYIENRFEIKAPEQTTEEFMREMFSSDIIQNEYKAILRDFLSQCDLVKFAKYEPPLSCHNDAYNVAIDFVEKTADKEIDNKSGKKETISV